MISRHARVQDKKATRKGFLLLLLSIGLLGVLFFLGIPTLAKFASLILDLKGSNQPVATEDKTPPSPPQFSPAPPTESQEETIEISLTAETGSSLKVFLNDQQVKETIIDEAGQFNFELTIDSGTNYLWAKATDTAGNESTKSKVWEIVYDTQAPNLEISDPQDGSSFTGEQKTITIKGTAEKNARVKVNDRLAIVSPSGEFSQKVNLQEGENSITITATDEGGNTAEKTLKVTYTP